MRPWLPLALAAALVAQPAAAFDLTGTWEGKQTCSGSSAGEKFSFSIPSTLLITQTGTALNIHVVSESGTDVYQGFGVDSVANPLNGDAYFVHCGTSDVPETGDDFDESGRATVKTKEETVGGAFKGTSAFFNAAPEVASCRWSYKRTDAADPDVAGCPG
jgi:hypothetical protein